MNKRYKEKREELIEYQKKYYQEHKAEILEKTREYKHEYYLKHKAYFKRKSENKYRASCGLKPLQEISIDDC